MKYIFIAILVLLLPTLALAENSGVEKTNYSTTVGYSKSKYSNNTYNTNSSENKLLSGMATFALGDFGGVTGYMDFNEYSSRLNSSSLYGTTTLNSANTSYGALIFLRDASIGRVGIAYGKTEIKIRSSDFKLYTDLYSLFLDYYFKNFTVAIENNAMEIKRSIYDADIKVNVLSLSGIWHIHETLLLRASTFAMDAENLTGISLIYQPVVFNQSTSFTFKYMKYDGELKSRASIFSINYYFDTRVSLKSRERKYTSYLYSNDLNTFL